MEVAESKAIVDFAARMISLMSYADVKKIIASLFVGIADIVGVERVCLILHKNKQLIIDGGIPENGHGIGIKLEEGNGGSRLMRIMKKRIFHYVSNPVSDADFSYMRQMIIDKGITSMLLIPLYKGSDDIGLLVIDFTAKNVRRKCSNLALRYLANIVVTTILAREEKIRSEEKFKRDSRLIALGEYVARSHHDIRHACAIIGAFPERIKKKIKKIMEGLPPAIVEKHREEFLATLEYTDIIKSRAKEVEDNAMDVLNYSKGVGLNICCANINEFIRKKITDFEKSGMFKQIKFVRDLDKRLDRPRIGFDQSKLSDCFTNLVQNANDAGASRVKIQTEFDIEGKRILIRVSNNGEKISPRVLDHIFDPFFTTKQNGTGLGLPSVKQNIIAHGGDVEVENMKEGGAEFRIFLPICR